MKKEHDKVPANQADEDTLAQLTDELRSSTKRAERALDEAVMKTEKTRTAIQRLKQKTPE